MEDKSDSRIKKIQRSSLESNEDGPLFSGPHISPNNTKNENHLEIHVSDGLKQLTLPNLPTNLNAIKNLQNKDNLDSFVSKDTQRKLERGFYSFWRYLDKAAPIFIEEKSQLNKFFLRKSTIDLLHSELYSWHTLLRHLVSMPSLANFNICQVLCHEKGTTNVNSYSFGSDDILEESKTSIDSFNKVFNQIKKSKSRQFSQTQLSIPEFNFVGSFLASTHQLKTHNILFLLSENSFFPISLETVEEVDEIIPQIKCVLEKVINKDLVDSKISNIFRLFELLPSPISIHNSMDTPVYQNNAYKSASHNEHFESGKVFEAELNGGFKLVMLLNSELSKSDVQHFQRVSLLGELLNTLQHELSNPLFGIQLATDFLNLQPSDDSVSESLGEISENCKRCQDIIRDFKFIYQGGDQFLNVSLEKIIKETLTLTKSASRGIKKELIIDESLSNDIINTNPTWLSQIIFNLIINSSQAILHDPDEYISDGIINIHASKKDLGLLVIKIEDNGPGIEYTKEASIFDPFYTTKEKGTGLGLAICQSLAKKLGGDMTYQRASNGGASFSLLLPINEIHKQ